MRHSLLSRLPMLCLFAATLVSAQQYTHVSGLIRDQSLAAVPDASVTLVSEETGFRRTTTSESNGWYAVASLNPGLYKITVRKEGFRTVIRFGVKLDAARPVQVDFTLPLGSVEQVVNVTDTPPLLNTEDAQVGTVIGRERIDKLPLNGRGLLSLLEFAPGVVVTPATRGEPGQFTASGQRPNANYFLVDGVSGNTGVSGGGHPAQSTGGTLPGMTAMGSLHGLVSLEALDEFRVQTSTAVPEFGRLPGAQVVLSTRSGSNDFRGSAFYYLRSGALDANNWFANRNDLEPKPLGMHDFGGSVSGPIERNKAFFFASYEGMRLNEPFAWRSPSPTPEARQAAQDWVRPVLDLYPIPNGRDLGSGLAEWFGQYERTSKFDTASFRVDYRPLSRLTLFARYNLAPSSNQFTAIQVNDLSINSRSFTFGTSFVLTPSAVFDLKLNKSRATGKSSWHSPTGLGSSQCYFSLVSNKLWGSNDDGCDNLFRFAIAGVGELVSGAEGDQSQDQWQLLPTAVLAPGHHQIRLGFDYRQYEPWRNDHTDSRGVIAEQFADLNSASRLWRAAEKRRQVGSTLGEYSLFAQDTWRVHPTLTATFGLRWEYSGAPELTSPDPVLLSPFVYPGQTGIWAASYGNLAPRLGVAWRPWRDGQTVIRGGWGRFYDSSLSIATDLINGGPLNLSQYYVSTGFVNTFLIYGFAPNLRLPVIEQWNATLEQGIGGRDVFSVAYVGSRGRDLLRRELGPEPDNERNLIALATNHGRSNYHGLQVQYRRPMAHGLQALASYSWSHSIDNSSSDSALYRIGPDLTAASDRGASDFDVRHAFTMALTYEVGERPAGSRAARLLSNWGVDGIFRARSGFPIGVLTSEYSRGLVFGNAYRPDLVYGQPVWIEAAGVPGGKILNRDAFQPTGTDIQGTLGRNAIRGFGMSQVDLALRREFRWTERRSLLLRVEAFNLLNHPNFADPARYLSSPLFGESPSTLNLMLGTGSPGSGLTPIFQTGGPRSVQLVLRLRF